MSSKAQRAMPPFSIARTTRMAAQGRTRADALCWAAMQSDWTAGRAPERRGMRSSQSPTWGPINVFARSVTRPYAATASRESVHTSMSRSAAANCHVRSPCEPARHPRVPAPRARPGARSHPC